ncbi:MAG TPA: 5-oxoprolinase subunit PxpA [Flavisolibacter sp.]|nr:5-oxoprolinase subunit PxpA [Flavisolibacter sp.]
MVQCDLNCDLGEGIGNDEAIMPFISSANIACGYHSGDENTMRKTLLLCQKYNVAIGAHPSYEDKENFGRNEVDCTVSEVYSLVKTQIISLKNIADAYHAKLHHIKPHGALYNKAAKDEATAKAIANAVKDVDEKLIVYGLSGSQMIREAITIGLKTASEVFADRTYNDDGRLTPRSDAGALIEDENKSIEQVLQMIQQGSVTSITGKKIAITAHTISIHGDGKHAVSFAKNIHHTLVQNNIAIKAV